jgi:hypothetical protein
MRDDITMRTTLEVDDDVLQAAKEIAALKRRTAGQVLSELARKALSPDRAHIRVRNGVPLLPPTPGRILTVKMVEDALDESEA